MGMEHLLKHLLTYPDANYHGTDSFSVVVSDGDASDSITINLTIAPVDDPSLISGDTSVVLNEDAIISGDLNATDVEGLTDGSNFFHHHSTKQWVINYRPN